VPNQIQFWLVSCEAGVDDMLVESRVFDPGTDPPAVYTSPEGIVCFTALAQRETSGEAVTYRVRLLEID
jgi:hypothetical protein